MKSRLLLFVAFLSLITPGCEKPHETVSSDAQKEVTKIENRVQEKTQLKQIILTLGSWRKADVEHISRILDAFNRMYPHIVIKFDPTAPSEYNDVIEAQLGAGTAPDLFYLRSFSHSRKLYENGFLDTLNDLAGLQESFPSMILEAWSDFKGNRYGVPLMAVSHGIYYNATFFKENTLAIPTTWEQLLNLAETIKRQGIVPFANATGETWTINGLILQNVIPNIIGGAEGRKAYYNGERCFNDMDMIASFQAVEDISSYISTNQKLLKYADSLQLFVQGKTPMWFGGSWDIPFLEEQQPDFEWSVFPIPPPDGKEYYITFHPDAAIGLNRSSAYIEEGRLFLEWMTTPEFANLVAQELPGFYPMHNEIAVGQNKHSQLFLDFNRQYKTDIRFVWGKIRDGDPDAYKISLQTSVDVMNHVISPRQAADALQAGLSLWYEPAMRCPR